MCHYVPKNRKFRQIKKIDPPNSYFFCIVPSYTYSNYQFKMSSNSVIPSGTILRFARDTKFQHTAVVLKDESVLQVKNLENPTNARQHFDSIGEWVAHLEITSKCTNFLQQRLSIENLEYKIDDDFLVEDLLEEASDYDSEDDCDCECDNENIGDSDEEYVSNYTATTNTATRRSNRLSNKARVNYAESDNEETDNNTNNNRSNTNTNTNRSNTNRSNTNTTHSNTNTNRSNNQSSNRTSSRLSNKPRVNYTELADEFPHDHINRARAEQVRTAKRNASLRR